MLIAMLKPFVNIWKRQANPSTVSVSKIICLVNSGDYTEAERRAWAQTKPTVALRDIFEVFFFSYNVGHINSNFISLVVYDFCDCGFRFRHRSQLLA